MNGDYSDAAPAPGNKGITSKHDGDVQENEEVEKEEEKGCDQIGELKKQEECVEGDEGEVRPKLAEGFYEIEAVRRKRVRKGEVQFLIKWRGWPETANTWEPYENLASCYDVIEAFEESLRSGKHKSRKRKRRSSGPVPQAKKKPQGNATSTSRAPNAGNVKFDEGNFVIPSLDDQNLEDGGRLRMDNNEALEQGNDGSAVLPPQVVDREIHYKLDPNLGKPTEKPFLSEGLNRLPVDILESEASEVICFENGHQKVNGSGVVEAGGFENGHQKVDGVDKVVVVQAGGFKNGHQKVDGAGVVQAGGFENGHQKVDGSGVVQDGGFENGHQKVDGSGVVQDVGFENGHQKVDGSGVVQDGGFENGHQKVDGSGVVQDGGFENGHQKVDGSGVVQAGGFKNGHQKVDGAGVVQAGGFENGHHKVDGSGVVQAGGFVNGHQKVDGAGVVQDGGFENGHQKVDGKGVIQAGGVEDGHEKFDMEGVVHGDSFENGHQKVDGQGEMQAGGRLESRKRKPASVKRYNEEQTPCITNYAAQDLTTKNTRFGGIVAQNRDQNSVYRSNDQGCKSKSDNVTDAFSITEIMKPISFSSSESVPDILVTFMAKRSDGKEVMVDNKYLKANNPLLLINYYEQHLNYNVTTGPHRPGRDSTT